MRRLLPVPSAPAEPDVDLVETYAYPPGRTWLRANMVAGLDGAAQAPDGLSAGLSSPADKRIFGVLRGLADVVIVGAATVRNEGYRPPRPKAAYADARAAAGQPPAPVIAIVSRSLAIDFTAPLFTEAITPTIVITCEEAAPQGLAAAREYGDVLVAGRDRVDFASALDALAARGLTRQLTEGGPHVLAQIAACGRLDELCLTVSPLLTSGPADRILAGPALADGVSMRPVSLLEEDGSLFTRYVRS
ncbi:pyrimidine reductase family protein [Embleya scabrispora]|uniref:pyrimidine reductase family protein n=1 Tax=Embleya scabrispora TaxID=159449 RepID=UPI0003A92DA4|nr:pyrimidine reductase family protein [Embleya scabrispora]MYS79528.1 pyrimidine reductase family protein [Streptomyces sp. SID5474]